MSRLLPIAFLLFLVAACTSREQAALNFSLSSAGPNGIQLQKVLDHYSGPADSLKLKAAKFLIVNMPYHYGFYGGEINKYDEVFSMIDSLAYYQGSITNADRSRLGEQVLQRYGAPQPARAIKVPDTKRVSADYLITNIDLAFTVWQTAPWSKKTSFADFCDYILPYRIRNEQIQHWRPWFYHQYMQMARRYPHADSPRFVFNAMNWDLSTETNFTVYFNKYFPFPQSISDVMKGKIGGCETTSFFSTTAMRAAGLPVALDFIPHWGNTNNRHYMPRLVSHVNPLPLLTNQNKAQNTWYLVDFSSEVDESRHLFKPEDMPPGLYVQYVRTIPKVYRYTYSLSPELLAINRSVPPDQVSPEFRSCDLKDVTEEYIRSSDITIKIGTGLSRYQLAYLCVFDITGWKPVALSRIRQDSAVFKKMGQNVIYLPAIYSHNVFRPTGPAFYIDSLNVRHQLAPRLNKTQELRVLRKTALYSYTAYHTEILKGGRFEGSDSADFKKADTLYTIDKYPFYMNEVSLSKQRRYRYLRYVAPHTDIREADNVAEVQFYGSGDPKPLKGAAIGSQGTAGHEITKAFDGDMNTYYENAAQKDGWIGLDLGADSQVRLSRIRYCPRNDTNCILPEDKYELFYWDGEWISLGVQKAEDYKLIYKNAPVNTLFWLKDLTGGNEERLFTYEDGSQVWW